MPAFLSHEKLVLMGGDLFALLLAFFLGRLGSWWWSDLSLQDAYFTAWWQQMGPLRILVIIALVLGTLMAFSALGHYSQRKPFWDEVRQTWKVLLTAAAMDMIMGFLGKWTFSRVWVLTSWALTLLLVPVFRVQVKHALIRAGGWVRPTVILGTGRHALDAAAALRSEPLMGFEIIAFLAPPAGDADVPSHLRLSDRAIPVLPLGEDPQSALEALRQPHVVVALDGASLQAHQRLLQRLSRRYQDLNIVPAIGGLPILGLETTHFYSHEVLLLRVRNNLARRGPQIIKRLFDVLVASLLLLCLSPLLVYFLVAIRRDGGEAIYGHRRVGRYGKSFVCYKFRSMVADSDAVLARLLETDPRARQEWKRDFKLRNDPRVTPIGAFLRKTSLDELPQLWNVLKGDMSLVGPRPVVADELERYGDEVDYYLEARPGITGLWQISGRNDVDYSYRVYLDSWYVKNWSLWYDIVILIKTVSVVFGRRGAY